MVSLGSPVSSPPSISSSHSSFHGTFFSLCCAPKPKNSNFTTNPKRPPPLFQASWQEVHHFLPSSTAFPFSSFYLTFLCLPFLVVLWFDKLAGVLVFSAIPFSAVKVLANSPLGRSLQMRMLERKKIALDNSSLYKALAQKARNER